MELGVSFVGRGGELGLLRAQLDEARAGRGRCVLLAGEPGIGKTRLAEEVARHAEVVRMAFGRGRASEDEGSPPYWMFRQLTRSLGMTLPESLAGGAGPDAAAQARFAAFETLADDLRAAAEPRGLLAVLDDLQWADAASLALLVHLARGIGRSRLMIVATFRDTEPAGREALSATLAALARESNLVRIRLVGLTEAEVAQYLALVTGTVVAPEAAALVSRRTGGNPFFVTEMGRLAEFSGRALPETVVDTVRAWLARLSAPCRQLVATAAVLGGELEPVALAEITRRPIGHVLSDLDEAAAAGMVAAGEGWRFRHDLIREAARLEVPTAARLTAHARLAAFLEGRVDAAILVSGIAHHWLESVPVGDPAHASAWAERAADHAQAQLAWERAAYLYGRALRTGAPLGAGERTRLLRRQGVASLRGGDSLAGLRVLTQAADAARLAGDPIALGEVALAFEGVSDLAIRGGPLAEEALAGLPPGDSPLRARLLALQAGEAGLAAGADPDGSSTEALAMAERLGDGLALRSALRSRQMARSGPDGVTERLELGDRMLALGLADLDDDAQLWGRLWRFDALAMLGRLDEAEGELMPIRVIAERLRQPLAHWHHLRAKMAIDVARGRFDEAATSAKASLALMGDGAHEALLGMSISVLICISELTGRDDLLTAPLLDVFERVGPPFVLLMQAPFLLQRGQRERARQAYASAPSPDRLPIPAILDTLATYTEMSAEFGPVESVAAAEAGLRRFPDLFVTGGAGPPLVRGSVRTYLGIGAAARGRLDEAVRELRLGIAANDQANTPPFSALARFELAKVLARRRRPGDAEEACALAAFAADSAKRLGMAPLRRDAAALVTTIRGQTPGPLTRREREVAEHIARGLTNKQIAALMHISERTAESHVQHILNKLGLANRTQIAGWAADAMRSEPPH